MRRLINKSVIKLPYQSCLILLIFFLSIPVSVFSQQTAEEFQYQQQLAFENYKEDDAAAFAAYSAVCATTNRARAVAKAVLPTTNSA